jgi:soluble lytic murein transglycosylase-like protein
LLIAPVRAQSPASVDAAARQRGAAAAMQSSLARQQESVQKQLSQSGDGSFFVLPRASSLGTVIPSGVSQTIAPMTPIGTPPVALLSPPPPECDALQAPEVESLVGETAQREGLSADLLRSVMRQESGFRPCAVSSKGAMGLMQLMPATAEQFGIRNPFDAASNLDAGAKFLKQLLNKYDGDIPKALGAYNAGPARVDAAGGVPAIPETMDYVRQILSTLPFH